MADDNLRPDPAGIFASDLHRRVLAHLSTPDDDVGWTPVSLLVRIAPDGWTPIPPTDEYGLGDNAAGVERLTEILGELKSDGYARRHAGDVWQMTDKGYEALTGSIANEPPPGAEVEGPAEVIGAATKIGKGK